MKKSSRISLFLQGLSSKLQTETKSVDHLAKGIAKSDEVLGRIVKITFTDDVDEGSFLQLQSLDENIEYVQKATAYQINIVPDDSLVSQQWALSKIQAFDAWDKTQGADSVLIGMIDTGIDYFHPDLKNKIWQNPGESGNGNERQMEDVMMIIMALLTITAVGILLTV